MMPGDQLSPVVDTGQLLAWSRRQAEGAGRDGGVVVVRAGKRPRTWGRAAASQRRKGCTVRRCAGQCPRRGVAGARRSALTVRRMQTKLHGWASDDVSRRFDDLFSLVYDPAFLVHAWERVSSNAGARSAGLDRATLAWIESHVGVEEFLGQIRDSLKSGEFVPVEVRRVPSQGRRRVLESGSARFHFYRGRVQPSGLHQD